MIKFSIITLFPEAVEPYLGASMMWKAAEKGLAEFELINLREFGLGPHKSVDDTPYGGGDGMLLRCEPVFAAIESVLARDPGAKVILPTPVGEAWTQEKARMFATGALLEDGSLEGDSLEDDPLGGDSLAGDSLEDARADAGSCEGQAASTPNLHYIILCPHYEGYDERILSIVDYKVSLGKFVLTGGELPALCIIDSIVRLIPGVLGGETSALIESFSDGDNLEYPQYTKPAEFRGMKVPEVLLSGHHGKVDEWRREHAGRAE